MWSVLDFVVGLDTEFAEIVDGTTTGPADTHRTQAGWLAGWRR